MPAPLVVAVPAAYNNNHNERAINGAKTQRSSPPLVHSFLDTLTHLPVEADAQGKGFFTTYSTDNGLALDQVIVVIKTGTVTSGSGPMEEE